VALSKWMNHEVTNSTLLSKFPSTLIPNSMDISVFCQRDRAEFRRVFGISDEKIVLLCTAHLNTNLRKGYHLLVEAMRILASSKPITERIVIFTIGLQPLKFPKEFQQFDMGFIWHEGLMSIIYNIADAFMLPSLQDNLPNTMLEALACGTPVVGFNVGGIPDAVIHRKTGYLVNRLKVEGLAEAVKEITVESNWILGLRDQCRRYVENNFAPEIQAQKYIALYQQLLE
jgi:glycosyltransferase involved in cell wall biosynthesis